MFDGESSSGNAFSGCYCVCKYEGLRREISENGKIWVWILAFRLISKLIKPCKTPSVPLNTVFIIINFAKYSSPHGPLNAAGFGLVAQGLPFHISWIISSEVICFVFSSMQLLPMRHCHHCPGCLTISLRYISRMRWFKGRVCLQSKALSPLTLSTSQLASSPVPQILPYSCVSYL